MRFQQVVQPTPNVSRNVRIVPIGIILHHTGGSYAGAVSWCLNPTSQVSYHCIINTNGDRTILAGDNQRTWHAGRSSFNGRSDCNTFMLGVAVSGDTNQRELTDDEIDSVAMWCADKIKQFNMPRNLSTITTHRQVSPGRKNDVDIRAERAIKNKILELLK
jgi:N-acetyl-anhydromuramyl-L-alanine amidase AmpD